MNLRRTNDISRILVLHAKCFPGDDYEPATQNWILWDDEGRAAGFCSAYKLTNENGVYLTRAGLLPGYRGKGLQRRMIRVRVQWAREIGAEFVVTYTAIDNFASIMNLLRSGFKFYTPANPWVEGPVLFFYRDL